MKIDEKNIKIWSTIGSRATFGMICLELAEEIENLIILTSDVSTSAGLDRFRKKNPEKFLETGIAEQNMIGISAGLANEGYNVITTTFAPFQTLRCCEQIKVNIGYMKQKVCMVGLASGLVLGTLGFTHACIEDLGVLRSIPNINLISPADSLETVKAIKATMNSEESCYIRLTGSSNNPIVYNKDYNFKIGKAVKLKNGNDITIFCSGASVHECLEAAKILENYDISSQVINMHTIKPIDQDAIKEACNFSKILFSVEEHNVYGGLGSAISEVLATIDKSPRLISLGVNDEYIKGGSYNYLKKMYGLTSDKIVDRVLKTLKTNTNDK